METTICARCEVEVDLSGREYLCLCGCEGHLCAICDIELNYE
jgi:hypothetical protein